MFKAKASDGASALRRNYEVDETISRTVTVNVMITHQWFTHREDIKFTYPVSSYLTPTVSSWLLDSMDNKDLVVW
jgi:hypothetical protein